MASGEVVCPLCGDNSVKKALMTPHIPRKQSTPAKTSPTIEQVEEAMMVLRKTVEDNADYVGDQFAEEARRIHYGETEERLIYGETTVEEAVSLHEEGIETLPLPPRRRHDS